MRTVEDPPFVLVGGWPGAGKSTLAAALAAHLNLPLLAKDGIKEALATALGAPGTVAESRRLGRAAVHAMLRAARTCPGAVLDSTWFPYTRPLVTDLPGRIVEVCCVVPAELARERYYARAAGRDGIHHDLDRTPEELWGSAFTPLGVGVRVDVDTSGRVDVAALATAIRGDRP
jgi:predicted kinase